MRSSRLRLLLPLIPTVLGAMSPPVLPSILPSVLQMISMPALPSLTSNCLSIVSLFLRISLPSACLLFSAAFHHQYFVNTVIISICFLIISFIFLIFSCFTRHVLLTQLRSGTCNLLPTSLSMPDASITCPFVQQDSVQMISLTLSNVLASCAPLVVSSVE